MDNPPSSSDGFSKRAPKHRFSGPPPQVLGPRPPKHKHSIKASKHNGRPPQHGTRSGYPFPSSNDFFDPSELSPTWKRGAQWKDRSSTEPKEQM